jgi:predicted membrane protein
MTSPMFWGVFLVLLGLSMILDHVFGISFPIIRVLVALFIISLGIKVLFGSFPHNWVFKKVRTEREAIFSKSDFRFSADDSKRQGEYNTVFGESILDLRDSPELHELDHTLRLNVAFGTMNVILPPDLPYTIEASTAFGNIDVADDSISFFGSSTFRSPFQGEAKPVRFKANVVFGNLSIGHQDPASKRNDSASEQ